MMILLLKQKLAKLIKFLLVIKDLKEIGKEVTCNVMY